MSRRLHLVHISFLLLLAICIQVWMLARNKLPSQDGVRFIRIASEFSYEPFDETLKRSVQHPLYPLLVCGYHETVGWLWGEGAQAWLRSAQQASALAIVLLVIPMYLAGLRLTEPTIAAGATALFTMLPIMARNGADALSESTYLLCFLLAFWAAVEFLCTGQRWWLLLAGLGSGLAYLARPEGLVLPVALIVALVGAQIRPIWRLPWKSVVSGMALLVLGTLVCVVPYVTITGRLTPKNSLNFILRRLVPPPPEIVAKVSAPEPPISAQGRQIAAPAHRLPLPAMRDGPLDFTPKNGSVSAHYQGYLPALKEFARELIESLHYVFALLALVGLRKRRLQPSNVLAGILAVLFSLAILQFASRSGYISTRHVITIACLACYSAAEGGWLLAGAAAAWWARRSYQLREGVAATAVGPTGTPVATLMLNEAVRRLQPRFAIGVLLLSALICLPRSWPTLHASRIGHLEAGRWLSTHTPSEALVLDTRGWAALYSDRQSYTYHGAEQAFEDPRLGYVVLEQEELSAETARGRTLRHLLSIGGERLAEFTTHAEPNNAVVVYGWHPDRLAVGVQGSRLR